MHEQLKLENQLCFRLYTASRLITQAYHPYLSELDRMPVNDIAKKLYLETNTVTPLLKRMEAEGFIQRTRGAEDARQVIVSLTEKGKNIEDKASCIPQKIGSAVACRSITPETAPALYGTLDDLIQTLTLE